ncbi:MAG TPA: hypothetical protein VFZ67_10790 [Nitrososphaera sp.]
MKKGHHHWKRSAATSLALMVLLSSIASVSILLYPDNNQAEAVIRFDGMKNLSTNSGTSLDPNVSTSGNNVYVVWSDNTPGNNEIILRASTDGGATFSSESKGRLTNTISASLSPKVSSSGTHVYVVWIEKDNSEKSDVHFRGSYNSGSGFGDIKNISNTGAASEAQIAASGNNIYVVWSDAKFGNSDIYFSSSSNGGQSFGTPVNLSDNAGISDQPQIVATVDGHVYVVWQDSISGSKEILLRASDNFGIEFDSINNLSNNDGSSSNPELAASESSVYVTWTDNTAGNVEVFFAASTNAGSSFGSAVNLSNTVGTSYRAQIAASGDKVYVTW